MKFKRIMSTILAMAMVMSSANMAYAEKNDTLVASADAVTSSSAVDINEDEIYAYSLLPLEEHEMNIDFTKYLPAELKDIKIRTILDKIKEQGYELPNGEITVWENYVDENGEEISDVWEKHNPDDVVDLSKKDLARYSQELIVGSGNQLDPKNIRFILDIDYLSFDNVFSFNLFEPNDESKTNIDKYISLGNLSKYNETLGDYERIQYIRLEPSVKYSKTADYAFSLTLKKTLDEVNMRVFKGKYETGEAAFASGNEVTEQITSEDGLKDKWLLSEIGDNESYKYLTFVYERDGKVSGIESLPVLSRRDGDLSDGLEFEVYYNGTEGSEECNQENLIAKYDGYNRLIDGIYSSKYLEAHSELSDDDDEIIRDVETKYLQSTYSKTADYSIKLALASENDFYSDVSMRVFDGEYDTAEKAFASNKEITDKILNTGLKDKWAAYEIGTGRPLTIVYLRNDEPVYTDTFSFRLKFEDMVHYGESFDFYLTKNDTVVEVDSDDSLKLSNNPEEDDELTYKTSYSYEMPTTYSKDDEYSLHLDFDDDFDDGEAESFFKCDLGRLSTGMASYSIYDGEYKSMDEFSAAVSAGTAKNATAALQGKDGYKGKWLDGEEHNFTLVYYRNGEPVNLERLSVKNTVKANKVTVGGTGYVDDVITETGVEEYNGKLVNTYKRVIYNADEDEKYGISMRYYDADAKEYDSSAVTKAVVGIYNSLEEAANHEDIKQQLFIDRKYYDDLSQGKYFTIFVGDQVFYQKATLTINYGNKEDYEDLPYDSGTPEYRSADKYFRFESLYSLNETSGEYEELDTYKLPFDHDSYYGFGYQTVFVNDTDVDMTKVSPYVGLSTKAQLYGTTADHQATDNYKIIDPVIDSEYVDFGNDSPKVKFEYGRIEPQNFTAKSTNREDDPDYSIKYTVAAENRKANKNYWVSAVKKVNGPKLYVNGPDKREIILNSYTNNIHDIFVANIGTEPVTGIKVELSADSQNIKLSDYWTIGGQGNDTLAPFSTTEKTEENGELPNTAKIRLIPTGEGEIKGTLIISADGQETRRIQLTGTAGNPKIDTGAIDNAVKYVPYSTIITTNNKYDWNEQTFTVMDENELPEGVQLFESGELYGVPQETGTFTFEVCVDYSVSDFRNSYKTLTLVVDDNTDENVNKQVDEGYSIQVRVPDFKSNEDKDREFKIEGAITEFIDFWLDGQKMVKDVDYILEEGSTKITIASQTFTKRGDGSHTIAAEYRVAGDRNNKMKKASQNYYRGNKPQSSGSQGGSSSSGRGGGGGGSSRSKVKVTFNANGGTMVNPTTSVLRGNTVFLETPVKRGYVFAGWYTDEALTKKFDANTKIKTAITLYAKWERASECKVWFDANGGNPVNSLTVQGDTVINELPVPTKANYSFVGWFKEDGTQFKDGDKVYESMTLKAEWELIIPDTPPEDASGFIDVETDAWYYNDVYWAYDRKLMVGYNNAIFAPKDPLKVSNIAAVLARLSGDDLSQFGSETGAWYEKDMMWAKANGIFGNNIYTADAYITRENMATILINYLNYKGIEYNSENEYTAFNDQAEISNDAKTSVEALNKLGVISGKSNNLFAPKDIITRAELAALTHRIDGLNL